MRHSVGYSALAGVVDLSPDQSLLHAPFAPDLEHVLENVLLIEFKRLCLILWHVGQIDDQADQIRWVGLHVGVLVLTNRVIGASRVSAWHIVELVRVLRIRQNVVVVHTSKPSLVFRSLSKH